MAEGDRPAISEDAAFSIWAGKDVITNPTQLKNLYENNLSRGGGVYDPANLIAAIEDQAFSVIVWRALFYPDPVLFAMGQAYRRDEESIPMNGFDYHVLRPDPTWPARRALRDTIFALSDDASSIEHPEHVIDVPQEDAQAWLTSLFAQIEWTQVRAWEDGQATFVRGDGRVSVRLEGDETLRVFLAFE